MLKHWAKADTGMLIASVLLVASVYLFFALISNLFFGTVNFFISSLVVLLIMEYAARELRRK